MGIIRDHRLCGLHKWHHLLPIWGTEFGVKQVIILTQNHSVFLTGKWQFTRNMTRMVSSYPYYSEILSLSNMTKIVFYLIFSSWDIQMLIPWTELTESCRLKCFQQRIFCVGHKGDPFSQYRGEIRILVKANSLGHLKILGLGMLANRPMLV